jgi:hypothetical protein
MGRGRASPAAPIDDPQGGLMDDGDVQNHIEALVAEEHRLYAAAESRGHETAEDRARLAEIRVQLDRYWDLLRQRRAQREFGLDPGSAEMRSGDVVERYQQ